VPLVDGLADTSAIPPVCCTVAKQSHPPPVASVHVTDEYPSTVRNPAAPSHVIGVDDSTRHEEFSVNCSCPVVVVPSVYVPSALAVQVPVTWSDPVTGADEHPDANPKFDKSSIPETLRHDDATFQLATTFPPQVPALEHDASPGPLVDPAPRLELDPELWPDPGAAFDDEPDAPLVLDPFDGVLPDVDEHAATATAGIRGIKACSFMCRHDSNRGDPRPVSLRKRSPRFSADRKSPAARVCARSACGSSTPAAAAPRRRSPA
jgi:hypothetical protein